MFDHPDFTLLSRALAGSPVTVFFQNSGGQFVWFENLQSIWASRDLIGATDADVFGPASVAAVAAAKQRALETDGKQSVEVVPLKETVSGQTDCHLKLTIEAMRDEASGDATGYLCSSIDVTRENQRERSLQALLLEVSHRSKNMLAMVLSLSAQTARSARTIEGFVRAFTGRVQSLAKSQDVITASDWRGAHLQDLVDQQVVNVVQRDGVRLKVTGDNPNFTPNAALHIGLALHELVANAIVHGALVQGDGLIAIECTVVGETDDRAPGAWIVWHETPGPTVIPLESDKSFGNTLLERIVPTAVNGTGKLSFDADGVTYTLFVAASEFG